jgi:haloalkane dehalogenase
LTTAFLDIAGPVRIYYREAGAGIPLVFLHGGWGYEVYPFDRAIEALRGRFRILIPDRSGYGRSTPLTKLPADFHRRAAIEMARFLDALKIERAVLWGHSDGAVIASPI